MITTIKESGFCHGVQAAIDRANANLPNVEKGVYLYGDLVNNSHVMSKYCKQGFIVANDINDIKAGSTVIIRAHGVPKAVYDGLLAKNATIEDCTCVKVKKIHKIVDEKSAGGKRIIIVGKKNHPEVIGIRGWCKNNDAVVLETPADLDGVDWTASICVVGQTTCKKDWWNEAVALILQNCPTADIHNTLCNVSERIDKAVELAITVDVMVVVGDKKSANSIELYDACAKHCINTVFVSSLEDLPPLPDHATIGLVGSASAPAEIINQIHDYLFFADYLADAKQKIEDYANRQEANLRLVKSYSYFVEDAVKDLFEQHRDGKRIRGAMIKLGEKIASGTENNFLEIAAAYELFQTAILIHDDIIDRSETRRGKKTIHTTNQENSNDAGHFGISRAICVGDYGLFEANYQLAHAKVDDATKVRLFKEFSNIQLITLEGEITDVILPYEPIDPCENYDDYTYAVNQIYRSKTAWYTLAGPLAIGAICGGGNEELESRLRDIALPLGIAFQIKDDLLGMYGNDKTLGKPAISDMMEGKQTLIYGYAYKHATPQQRVTLNELYGKRDAALQDLELVREIFTATGAKQFSEDKINELSQESLEAINALQTDDECKMLLRGLVHYLVVRKR